MNLRHRGGSREAKTVIKPGLTGSSGDQIGPDLLKN